MQFGEWGVRWGGNECCQAGVLGGVAAGKQGEECVGVKVNERRVLQGVLCVVSVFWWVYFDRSGKESTYFVRGLLWV